MTQKPISTVTYNTEPFLLEKLDSLVSSHIIQTYQYICHIGEDGDKNHIHLRIEPNKKLDVMDLTDLLKEYEPGKNKPIKCLPWRPSKEEDWFLYVVHDKDYLSLKYGGGEKGEKIPYEWQNIKVPENYNLEAAFIRAKATLQHSTSNIATRIKSGENALDLLLSGENVYTVNAIQKALSLNDYQRLLSDYNQIKENFQKLSEEVENQGYILNFDDKYNFLSLEKCE